MADDETDVELDNDNNNLAQNNKPVADNSDISDTIKVYKDRLMEELGFADLGAVEKEEVEQKIESLVNSRIINLILLYLPDDQVADFEKVLEGKNQEEIDEFVAKKIHGMQDKVLQELMNIRDELLAKVKTNVS